MLNTLRYVLLADGGKDAALIHVIDWAIRAAAPAVAIEAPRFRKHGGELERIIDEEAVRYRPDLVFVHRDAEREELAVRRAEIPTSTGNVVRIVPVHMTEAWLLVDELAIRRAAGNPSGTEPLNLPRSRDLEGLVDPKQTLRAAFIAASGFSGARRRARFERGSADWAVRVAAIIRDFASLRQLAAYIAFEAELKAALDKWQAAS